MRNSAIGLAQWEVEEIVWIAQHRGRPCAQCGQRIHLRPFSLRIRCPHCGRLLEYLPDKALNLQIMDADQGMRLKCSAAQLARFEYAAVKASQSVLRAIRNLAPRVKEKEIASSFDGGGLPLSCHPMVSFGEKARRGLSSPSDHTAKSGDAFTLAFGVEGSLNLDEWVHNANP